LRHSASHFAGNVGSDPFFVFLLETFVREGVERNETPLMRTKDTLIKKGELCLFERLEVVWWNSMRAFEANRLKRLKSATSVVCELTFSTDLYLRSMPCAFFNPIPGMEGR